MASAYPSEEIEPQDVHEEIQALILILSRRETIFSNLEHNTIIFEFLTKLNQIIVQLQQISSVLEEFLDENTYIQKLESYVISNQEVVKQILEEVQECIRIAESCIKNVRQIRSKLEESYKILTELILGGLEIPKMEDFGSPVHASNTVRHSLEGGNTAHTTHPGTIIEKKSPVMTLLISILAEKFAGIRINQTFLEITVTAFTKVSDSLVNNTYKLLVHRKDAYNKIFKFKREFNMCGAKKQLERLSCYLEENITDSQHAVTSAIKQCLCQVWESVESSKEQNPNKSGIDIIKEMSEMSVCSGLVRPITTKVHCTVEEAWDFVIRLSSSGRDPALL